VHSFTQTRNPRCSSRAVDATVYTIRHPAPQALDPPRRRAISHVSRQTLLQTLSALRQTLGRVGTAIRGPVSRAEGASLGNVQKQNGTRLTCPKTTRVPLSPTNPRTDRRRRYPALAHACTACTWHPSDSTTEYRQRGLHVLTLHRALSATQLARSTAPVRSYMPPKYPE
jgi:hypothetical protein